MATWTQAKKWLKEGKKISRPIWHHETYWELGFEETISCCAADVVGTIRAHVHLKQLEAKDWEIWVPNLPEIMIIQCPICKMADVYVDREKKMDYKAKFCKCLKSKKGGEKC